MAARRVLLLLAAAAVALLAAPQAATARPCGRAQTLLISFSSFSRPNPDPADPSPLTTTVVTVLRVRRLGPHRFHPHHDHLQIRRPAEPLHAAVAVGTPETDAEAASSSFQERAKDILVVVSGLLFGFGCGALTAASMYLVWSLVASTGAAGPYEELYSDDEDEDDVSDDGAESPKKAGYVIIHGAEDVVAAGKN
ncbi:uncharacterized protein LOC123450041 [Hordeum vulgare subsp. vulgare]|uniref:Uncharacterized protein n=1 Tax=Hordeum vulgare subsp. vulgare TaxID=112509 RepID=A0A8I6X6Q2_HORVV|nr:uncharacterized protein LOC123450041 [Hordeum vulgare subsp. vulgare]KAI4999143.1 hypothetical protein ZWY2020_059896 [Hordeum vulgare]